MLRMGFREGGKRTFGGGGGAGARGAVSVTVG